MRIGNLLHAMKERWSSHQKKRQMDYDYLPLFYLDQGLSDMAKVIMSLTGGGERNRSKALEHIRDKVPNQQIEELRAAFKELEQYGYLTTVRYKGEHGEDRVDRRICICPNCRLPKLTEPTGGKARRTHCAVDMYDDARRFGFIAETGKDTTYFLYDALRIFTAVEGILCAGESVVLPIIGLENMRVGTSYSELSSYPHCDIAAVLTTDRVIIVQEHANVENRRAGIARILFRDINDVDSVTFDEPYGRLTIKVYDPEPDRSGAQGAQVFNIDLLSEFAISHFEEFYRSANQLTAHNAHYPPVSYYHEEHYNH